MDDDDMMWTLAASAAAFTAAAVARKALASTWARRRGAVPGNPMQGGTSWGEAAAWAVASGVVIGLARLVAQRGVVALADARRLPSSGAEPAGPGSGGTAA